MAKGKGNYGRHSAHVRAGKDSHGKCLSKKVVSHKVCADWAPVPGAKFKGKAGRKTKARKPAKKTYYCAGTKRSYGYGKWPSSYTLNRKTGRVVKKAVPKQKGYPGKRAPHGKCLAVYKSGPKKGKCKDFAPKNPKTSSKKPTKKCVQRYGKGPMKGRCKKFKTL